MILGTTCAASEKEKPSVTFSSRLKEASVLQFGWIFGVKCEMNSLWPPHALISKNISRFFPKLMTKISLFNTFFCSKKRCVQRYPSNPTYTILILHLYTAFVHLSPRLKDFLLLYLRGAILHQICSFFEHCSKSLWPPPFVLNIMLQIFFDGFLKKRVNVCRDKIDKIMRKSVETMSNLP